MNEKAFIRGYMEKTAAPKWLKLFRSGELGYDDVVKIMRAGAKPRMLEKVRSLPGDKLRAVVHQGSPYLDPDAVKAVENSPGGYMPKPEQGTGLWTTPGGSEDNHWTDFWNHDLGMWDDDERIHKLEMKGLPLPALDQSGWVARLKPDARVATIDSLDDLKKLVERYPAKTDPDVAGMTGGRLDFERMAKDYDVIHLTSDGQRRTRMPHSLIGDKPPDLYGWDLASSLILNKDALDLPKEIIRKGSL